MKTAVSLSILALVLTGCSTTESVKTPTQEMVEAYNIPSYSVSFNAHYTIPEGAVIIGKSKEGIGIDNFSFPLPVYYYDGKVCSIFVTENMVTRHDNSNLIEYSVEKIDKYCTKAYLPEGGSAPYDYEHSKTPIHTQKTEL